MPAQELSITFAGASGFNSWDEVLARPNNASCPGAEAGAGAPFSQELTSKEPESLRLAASASMVSDSIMPSGSDVAAGTPKASPHYGHAVPPSCAGSCVLEEFQLHQGSRPAGLCKEKAEMLSEYLAEFTGLQPSSRSLPADFKISLQVAEHMGQQSVLMRELKRQLEGMREELTYSIQSVRDGMDAAHEARHNAATSKLCSEIGKVSSDVCSHHEVLHEKLNLMRELHNDAMQSLTSATNNDEADPLLGKSSNETKRLTWQEARQGGGAKRVRNCSKSSESAKGSRAVDLDAAGGDDASVIQISGIISPMKHERNLGTASGSTLSRNSSISSWFSHIDLNEKPEDYPLRRFISHPMFEWLCAFVIITNAVTIGISAEESIQWAVSNPGVLLTVDNPVIALMNKIYVFFYFVELVFKLWVWRCEFFTGVNCRWNIFDLVLVASGLYDATTEFAPINMGDGMGVSWLRVLRILKTLKLLRVIRVMRFFQVLRLMVSSILGSMSTLLWSIVMISIMLYMFGLCFLNAVTAYLNDTTASDISEATMTGIDLYWSSVPQSMMTLFWSVTGGADWEPLAAPIRDADSFFFVVFFFYIAFAAFAVLNVLTGMFVDTAMQVAQQDENSVVDELINRPEVKHFRERVHEQVVPKGFISKEFIDHCGETDTVAVNFQKALEIEHADCVRILGMMDADKTGIVNLEEFIKGCCHAKGSISGLDMVLLMNETKHVNKQLLMAMDFLEERFNEMLWVAEGTVTSVEGWQDRLNDAKADSGSGL